MKYKVGDKVRIKSKDWWNANKNEFGDVSESGSLYSFVDSMSKYLGMEARITEIKRETYSIDLDRNRHYWHDWMFDDSYNPEKSILSEEMIKDIADVVNKHNLGVSISENGGKLIIEPLKVEKEEDLPIDTPVMVSEKLYVWRFRYYAGEKRCFINSLKHNETADTNNWKYIIPFDKFNPLNIEESLKYNIVKQ